MLKNKSIFYLYNYPIVRGMIIIDNDTRESSEFASHPFQVKPRLHPTTKTSPLQRTSKTGNKLKYRV